MNGWTAAAARTQQQRGRKKGHSSPGRPVAFKCVPSRSPLQQAETAVPAVHPEEQEIGQALRPIRCVLPLALLPLSLAEGPTPPRIVMVLAAGRCKRLLASVDCRSLPDQFWRGCRDSSVPHVNL